MKKKKEAWVKKVEALDKKLKSSELVKRVNAIMMASPKKTITLQEYMSKPRTGVLCKQCGSILVSFYTHDYKTCGCPNEAMIDGGPDYTRYGAVDINKILMVRVRAEEEKKSKNKRNT